MTLDALTDAVWKRLEEEKPRAFLIGEQPDNYHKYNYVNEKPYDVIFLGILSPGKLLHMPDETVCQALLDDMPVYLWHQQPHHAGRSARPLRQALYKAERRLLQFGVQPIAGERQLLTADLARQIKARGEHPALDSRLTPLARDILEGKAT